MGEMNVIWYWRIFWHADRQRVLHKSGTYTWRIVQRCLGDIYVGRTEIRIVGAEDEDSTWRVFSVLLKVQFKVVNIKLRVCFLAYFVVHFSCDVLCFTPNFFLGIHVKIAMITMWVRSDKLVTILSNFQKKLLASQLQV